MRHHTKYVPRLITNTRNITKASIRIACGAYNTLFVGISVDHLSTCFQLIQGLFVRIKSSLPMGNRDHQSLALVAFPAEIYILADKLLIGIAQQRTWQQMRFTKYLEAIAYPQHLSSLPGKFDHTLHNRAESGDGPATEIITIGESAGQHDTVFRSEPAEVSVLMPKHNDFLAKVILQGILHITITIRTRENNYSKLHEGTIFLMVQRYENSRSKVPPSGEVIKSNYISDY